MNEAATEIVLVDENHVEAPNVKTRQQVREVLNYAKANNIKYYRGVVASSGKTYNELGESNQEWYENPYYVEPTPVVEEEPVPVPEDVPLVEDPLEPEPELTETAVEAETEPEVDYKAMYEAVVLELENVRNDVSTRDEHIRMLEEQIASMEKESDNDDTAYVELQDRFDELTDALQLVGKYLHA